MSKFEAPLKRKYTKGENITVSLRMPESLKNELDNLSEEYGKKFVEFVLDGLDQWASFNRESLDKEKTDKMRK